MWLLMRYDIHGYENKLKREWKKILKSSIPEESKNLLERFKRDLEIQGISASRIWKYLSILRYINENYNRKPFDKWDEEDIKVVMAVVQQKVRSGEYSENTGYEYRKTLKKFFKWLYGAEWRGLKILRGNDKRNASKPEYLTEEEILKMIEYARHLRDKALIAVTYEGGLRIGEAANLKIKDIIWFSNVNGDLKVKIRVSGKTGERQIPLVIAVPYLKRWLEVHPRKDEPEAFVFCSLSQRNFGEAIEYQTFRRIIEEAAKKAGIKKRVNPHLLRHSRATVLANYLTEAQMCEFFGWVQGSDMPRIYVHLSGRDIDKAIMRYYGLEEEEEKKEVEVKPKKCPRCGYLNAPTDIYCGRCALILDEGERAKLEMEEPEIVREMLDYIMEQPEKLRMLKEMLDFVEKLRTNPQLIQMLIQLRDEKIGLS